MPPSYHCSSILVQKTLFWGLKHQLNIAPAQVKHTSAVGTRENKFQEVHFICQGMGNARPVYRVLSMKADQDPGLIELIIYLKRQTDKLALFI